MDKLMEILRSSVRPIVTYIFAVALAVGVFVGVFDPVQFFTLAGSIMSFWFAERTAKK